MKIAIPYKYMPGPELKYCLRGIEMFIDNPEVVIIGDKTPFKVQHISFKDHPDIKFKERNVFQKLLLMKDDFLLFNDDFFLLQPFQNKYHYSGTIQQQKESYPITNNFRKILQNTLNLYGNIPNYFRHGPLFIEREKLEPLTKLDWNVPWGYCSKSIYCHVNEIKGEDYPDLKIRVPMQNTQIVNLIKNRPYFSTGDCAVNGPMIKVLETLYPNKSKYE
jgi:hypothetical protein